MSDSLAPVYDKRTTMTIEIKASRFPTDQEWADHLRGIADQIQTREGIDYTRCDSGLTAGEGQYGVARWNVDGN